MADQGISRPIPGANRVDSVLRRKEYSSRWAGGEREGPRQNRDQTQDEADQEEGEEKMMKIKLSSNIYVIQY